MNDFNLDAHFGPLGLQNYLIMQDRKKSLLPKFTASNVTHYTDINGLYGILESNGFWFSDHRFLNDTSEYVDGKRVAIDVITEFVNSKLDLNADIKKLLLAALVSINEDHERVFVCSFSEEEDSLDQWRRYSDDGQGVSLTFEVREMRDPGRVYFELMPKYESSKVIYNDALKREIIENSIISFCSWCDKHKENGEDLFDRFIVNSYMTYLSLLFVNFKHEAYESEKEIRCAFFYSDVSADDFGQLSHRVRKNQIIPYFDQGKLLKEWFDSNSKLPLRNVMLGPTVENKRLTAIGIREFLNSKGYSNVPVLESTLPYRS